MSYKINKTNGDLLVDLVDGDIDQTSTDITLIGRNYKGFGEFLNENNIKMLENFASSSAPSSPLVGQLWYDTAEERLKLYTGDTFRAASGAVVSQTRPNLVEGDLWVDSLNNQMYFYDGADVQLVGPNYTASQKKTGLEAGTVIDDNGTDQVIVYLYISGILTGIFSTLEFRPRINIVGYPEDPNDVRTPKRQLLKAGFNPVNPGFWYRGTAESSRGLVSDSGEEFTEANFMKTDRDTSTTGSISIKSDTGLGLEFGLSDTVYGVLKVTQNYVTALEMQQANRDFALRVKRGNEFDNALYVKTAQKRIGIFNNNPQYGVDINAGGRFVGDLIVEGNFTVNGDSTFISTATLQVEDKNVELAASGGLAILDNAGIDGAGLIIKSTEGDKAFTYNSSTNAWTSDINLELTSGANILINGVSKLSEDRLDNSIKYAEGLISIGKLNALVVDDITLNDAAITSSDPLNIVSSGVITVNNQKIQGVATPISAVAAANSGGTLVEDNSNTVATKGYVDTRFKDEPVVTSLDLTGLSNPVVDFNQNGPYNDAISLLNYMYPASEKAEGTEARIIAISYSSTTVTGIDVTTGLSKSTVSVYVDPDDSSTPQLESVLSDIAFTPVSANANLVPQRATMDFVVSGGTWSWVRTTVLT